MKNITIYFGIIGVVLTTLSCKDEKNETIEEPITGIFVSAMVTIGVRDKSGKDLLDPNLPSSMKNFKVYYQVNGAKKLYYDPWMGAPGGYLIEKYSVRPWYHVKLFLDSPSWVDGRTSDSTITYLEFEDGSTDTIRAQYTVGPGRIEIDRAAYNGIQFFDRFQDYTTEPTYVVIK